MHNTDTIRQHKQFLKNYNMIRQIGHYYYMSTRVRHGYDTLNDVLVKKINQVGVQTQWNTILR